MEIANFSRWWLLVFAISFCYGDTETEYTLMMERLNKPYVKSIKSSDGDIIDCVHISQQPAFDDPSLKSHSIQMRPSYHPDEKIGSTNGTFKQMWQTSGGCPEETIPVRRTKKEDLLRASALKSFGKKQQGSIPISRQKNDEKPDVDQSVHEHAVAYISGNYYGAKATMNVWAPYVQKSNEFSLSQLWIVGGSPDVNTIEAGWQKYPALYGDYNTRLFIYWTRDNYKYTGCYNLLCSGFIQTNNEIVLGGTLSPVSSYGGNQYSITILIWKDRETGNWWMKMGDHYVGYWPYHLFTHLNHGSASMVEWGGEVVNTKPNGYHTDTNMGSGAFPYEGYGKASFFLDIQYVDGYNHLITPTYLYSYTYNKYCYDVKIGGPAITGWGSYFYYGGSGRNSLCP